MIMDLTLQERLLIANQLKMLEKLYPDEADYYSKHRKAIENGYKLHYAWLVEHFSDEMTEEECREVLDILDMYRVLTFSYQKLKDKSGIDEQDIRFRGFDGNNETNQYSYVQYFVIDLERYNELRYGGEYPNFNSHCLMTEKYRRMLSAWKIHKDKFELNKKQIKEILEA
jgi:uncharacterized protein YfbU (UPF0304 family)